MKRFFAGVHAQRRAIAVGFAAVVGLGVVAALGLPTSILPEVTFPRITILAESGEQPSETMLRTVTRPIEESLHRVPGVGEIRSSTSRGSAEITVDGAWGSDMNLMLQRVQAQIATVRSVLPSETVIDARVMNPTLFPVLAVSLTSDRVSLARLRDVAVTMLKPELSRLPGVAEVIVQGGRRLEARVELNPAALQARGLDAASVAEAIRSSSALASVGLMETNAQLYLGLADGRPTDLASLEAVPIPTPAGAPVPLGQLGRVALAEAPEFVRYRARAREAVLVNLLRRPSASAVELSDAAHRWFADNRGRLPGGITIETFYDQADLVRASAGGVRDSLVVGALLAILVVITALGSLRLGLAGAIVLPGSIALTLIALAATHQSLNMMTMGGIAAAVGLVLDDAIVVVEHLATRVAGSSPASRWDAMVEITPTLFGSSLCTLAIFLPFVSLGGVTGAFFRVLSLSMALMLTSSLLLCLTVVPLLSPGALHRVERPHEIARRFDAVLRAVTGHRWIGTAVVAVLIVLAVLVQRGLGTGFLPEMDEGSLILDYIAPPGTSLTVTDQMLQEVEKEIDVTPEIASWSRRTGDQLGFFVTEPNIGDYVLRLKGGRRRGAEAIADDLRARIEAREPALAIEFGQLVEDVIGDLIATPQPIEIRVFSEDRAVCESKAREVATLIEDVPGVVDVNSGVVVSGPTVRMVPRAEAARAGVDAERLSQAVTPAVAGIDVGEIVRGIRAWPVRVTLPPPQGLGGAGAFAALAVPVRAGGRARLGDLATIEIDPGETEIHRDDLRGMVAVTARLSGRDLGSAVREIQRRLAASVALPPDASIQYGGLWAQQQASFRDLALVLLAVTSLVALVLLVSFRSWVQLFAVLAVVAASLFGVFAALSLSGMTFNIASYVGAIMTVGIVAENAFFLVASHRAALGRGLAPIEAARAAAHRRARPVLMTTVAGIAALVPLALGIGSRATLLQPLAIAVIGGFTTSAPLLLAVLPALLAGSSEGD